ncbi:hypothetical protein [Prosthecomicrobium sp. N25]|uniref:hypothetical protein n=1 Tax=Prosthecomicrobium sp. N25 TaxID=3129254 RepID=UPI003078599D
MTLAAFATSWRFTLSAGILLVVVALAAGVFSSGAAPAWIFVAGAVLVLAGLVAIGVGMWLRARDAIEDVLDGDDDPSGPTGPKISRSDKR